MTKTRGFTILELMVVIIIVGVLGILFIPSMRNPLEQSRAKNAEFNLLAIYSAEKRYFLREGEYYLSDDAASINRQLLLKIDDAYFDYNITGPADKKSYTARAIRTDGICGNMNMSLSHNNSIVDKRGCSPWQNR